MCIVNCIHRVFDGHGLSSKNIRLRDRYRERGQPNTDYDEEVEHAHVAYRRCDRGRLQKEELISRWEVKRNGVRRPLYTQFS
jgi:hypothetical protein